MARKQIRPITILGETATIPLTKGKFAIVDAAVVPLLASRHWCASETRGKFYASTSEYVDGTKRQRTVFLHRLLLSPAENEVVDHIDGDGLNNRLSNLRLASYQENNRNRRRSGANTSGYKGVSYSARHGRWLAKIKVDNRTKQLGVFVSPEDAHAAYARASREVFGEFGRAL